MYARAVRSLSGGGCRTCAGVPEQRRFNEDGRKIREESSGIAYVLNTNTDKDTRRFWEGHNGCSKVSNETCLNDRVPSAGSWH